jgi:hypothetical protein
MRTSFIMHKTGPQGTGFCSDTRRSKCHHFLSDTCRPRKRQSAGPLYASMRSAMSHLETLIAEYLEWQVLLRFFTIESG